MSKESRKKLVSAVLKRDVTNLEMQYILEDWKAFHDDPVKYSGTVVVQMVNEYLDGYHTQEEMQNQYTGAQHVMELDLLIY